MPTFPGMVLFWVLTLVTPAGMPNATIAAPTLDRDECLKLAERVSAPFPVVCFPELISWEDLT